MAELPRGTVTFLFTDVEQSTRLLDELGEEAYGRALEEHRRRLRAAFRAGVEVDTQGDALFFAFGRADDAVRAAADGQRALDGLPLRVRMGLHTGQPSIVGDGYVGLDVHRAARICAAAHGGQVVLSQTTRELVDIETRDLGEHRLKDLTQPQRLHQLLATGLEADFAPLRTLENRPTNLPAQTTPLVGRSTELAALAGLLAADSVRLVTLTGPGGSGKTRLALHAAAEAVERFPQGVWLVSLEAVHDPALLLPAIAQTLGLTETSNVPLERAIREHLRDKRVLLVLDNFEQLVEAARTVSDLLDAAPGVHVLVTSRVRLRTTAEHAFPVPPLGLPDPRALPAVDALSQYDAVALFLERARAVAPGFTVGEENAPAIAELCVRLDGLPLAIELAAARVKLLPPQALLTRLGQRLDLLRGGARDRPERQQTLRAALDWSFELLDPAEQQLFARLSVFAGGFVLEAAEAICDADLDAVEVLLENNLLRSDVRAVGEPRFSMLESIREYGREQLECAGALDDTAARHARWYADWLGRRTDERLAGALRDDWEPEEDEHDNIRAALAWAREHGEVDLELHFATGAGLFYWPSRGHLTEGRRFLEDVLARSRGADERLRARALLAAAQHAWRQGDFAASEQLAAEAAPMLERFGDRIVLVEAEIVRGIAAGARGDMEAEDAHYRAAERTLRELGHTDALNSILSNRAYDDILAGNVATAERRLREVVEAATGTARLFASANLGLALTLLGRVEEAEARFAELVEAATETGSTELLLYGFEGLALVAGSRAEDLRAAHLWGVTSGIREATGYVLAVAEQRLHDELVPEVRARTGEAEFDLAHDVGRRLSFPEAAAYALRRT